MDDGITFNIEEESKKPSASEEKKNSMRKARETKFKKKNEIDELKKQLDSLKKYVEDLKSKKEPEKPKEENQSRHTADEFLDALNKKLSGGPTLDDLDALPLEKYTDYLKYNEMLRKMRMKTRLKIRPFKYPPLDLVPKRKIKITRSKNKNQPICINIKDSANFVHFTGEFKHGDEVEMPHCIIEKINSLATPVYKQVKYHDGSSETILDYWDNVYSCQMVV